MDTLVADWAFGMNAVVTELIGQVNAIDIITLNNKRPDLTHLHPRGNAKFRIELRCSCIPFNRVVMCFFFSSVLTMLRLASTRHLSTLSVASRYLHTSLGL
jgi:hypothetical protein